MSETGLIWQPEYSYITDPSEATAALARFESEPVVGLDTETFWEAGTKAARVSLVQVSSMMGETVVLDALAAGVESVRPLVESGAVMMAAHNARFDEMILQGAGLRPVAFVDTLRMARMALMLPSYTLAAVTAHLFGIALDKTFQKSNWRRRPLTRSQISYAAADARVTLLVYQELRRILDEQGRLEEAIRSSTLVEKTTTDRTPRKRRRTPDVPSAPLTDEENRAVAYLKKWRLARANTERLPAYMICPDRTLEHLARTRPTTLDGLLATHGLGESKVQRYGEALLEAVRAAFE